MTYHVPAEFCGLPSDKKTSALKSAEDAMRDQQQVYFKDKHFTNFDELKSYLTQMCKDSEMPHDWPGEIIDDK